jgi:hypothetical protein
MPLLVVHGLGSKYRCAISRPTLAQHDTKNHDEADSPGTFTILIMSSSACGSRSCRNRRVLKAHVSKSKVHVRKDKCGKQFVKIPAQRDSSVWRKRTVVEIDLDTSNSQNSPYHIRECDFYTVIRSNTFQSTFTYWVQLPLKPKNAHPYIVAAVADGLNSSIVVNVLQHGVTTPKAVMTASQTNPGTGTDFAADIRSPAITFTPFCNKDRTHTDWVQTAVSI